MVKRTSKISFPTNFFFHGGKTIYIGVLPEIYCGITIFGGVKTGHPFLVIFNFEQAFILLVQFLYYIKEPIPTYRDQMSTIF